MNYKVITESDKLKEFIEWLPELKKDECFYVCLFGRSKYGKEFMKMSADKQQLKRFTSSKEYLYEKISQLEIEIGRYYQKHQPLPQECLSLYIMPNPRSQKKSLKHLLKTGIECYTEENVGYNVQKMALTSIQKSASRTVYMDFDFDDCTIDEKIEEIYNAVNKDSLTFVQTRGGFHVLIEVSKIQPQYMKTYYNNITKIEGCDVRGDNLLPVPGSYQGGFTPKLIK